MSKLPEDEDDEMEEALSSALRGNEMDLLQGLVAQTLASALFAYDQTYKVRQALEAYFLLDEPKQAELVPEADERTKLRRAHELVSSLMAMEVWVEPGVSQKMALIPWSFGPEEASLYFSDFVRTKWRVPTEESTDGNYFERLYMQTFEGAPAPLCLALRGQFLNYILPRVLRLIREIHQKFIQPEVWERAILAFAGRHKGSGGKSGDIGPVED